MGKIGKGLRSLAEKFSGTPHYFLQGLEFRLAECVTYLGLVGGVELLNVAFSLHESDFETEDRLLP